MQDKILAAALERGSVILIVLETAGCQEVVCTLDRLPVLALSSLVLHRDVSSMLPQ